MTFQFTSLD